MMKSPKFNVTFSSEVWKDSYYLKFNVLRHLKFPIEEGIFVILFTERSKLRNVALTFDS